MKLTTNLLFILEIAGYTAWAADVTFASELNCTGQALYGAKGLKDVTCYDLSDLGPSVSVVLANLEPDQRVDVFSDGICQNKTFTTSQDTCYSDPQNYIGSFQVVSNTAVVPAATKDLVPYGVKLSNYKDLAVMDPYSIDVKYSTFFIALALTTSSVGLNIAAAVTGCTSVDGKNPVSVFGCVVTPIATILSYAAGYFFTQAGRSYNQAIQMSSGNFGITARSIVDQANHDYVFGAFNQTSDGHVTHVGYAKRDMGYGEQTSPIYEVAIGDSGMWHMSAFLDEDSGEFVHHIRSAEDSELRKRATEYNYDTIRWSSGGFDFHFCRYQTSAGYDGYSDDLEDMYQTAYDQLTCIASSDSFSAATKIGIDMYNTGGVLIGELEIIPYSGSTTLSPPGCATKTIFPVNQGCIID